VNVGWSAKPAGYTRQVGIKRKKKKQTRLECRFHRMDFMNGGFHGYGFCRVNLPTYLALVVNYLWGLELL